MQIGDLAQKFGELPLYRLYRVKLGLGLLCKTLIGPFRLFRKTLHCLFVLLQGRSQGCRARIQRTGYEAQVVVDTIDLLVAQFPKSQRLFLHHLYYINYYKDFLPIYY